MLVVALSGCALEPEETRPEPAAVRSAGDVQAPPVELTALPAPAPRPEPSEAAARRVGTTSPGPGLADPSAEGVERPSEPSMPAAPLRGVKARKQKGGGRAGALDLGGLDPAGEGAMGGLISGSCHAEADGLVGGTGAFGVGVGGGGYGIGGIGSGGGGGGIGLGRHAGMGGAGGVAGLRERARGKKDFDASPLRYAEINRARGAPPVRFIGRTDARVQETVETWEDQLSTFAVDVDTAAYAIARRTVRSGRLPEPSLVRPEEMLNAFRYDFDPPTEPDALFAIEADGARSPLEEQRHLLRIGLQARQMAGERPPANLVFLVDTSCSMTPPDRLELAKTSIGIAVSRLSPRDRVAITTYAGGVALVLPPTSAGERGIIAEAIARLRTGGGTAMQSGLEVAYAQAAAMLSPDTVTRIIVCSDGDANIGARSREALFESIAGYVRQGVRISTIGFGEGNYRDAVMEHLANRGNGNYYYVDSEAQAAKVFGRDLEKMVWDVAEDVKVQVELDGRAVRSHRLVGYENRALAHADFRKDEVDAGEIGAGHQVTAIYELELAPNASGRLATVRVRAKRPGAPVAKETSLEIPVEMVDRPFGRAPADLRFATAVMGLAELWRQSPQAAGWSYAQVIAIAEAAGARADPERAELVALARRSAALAGELARAD